MEEMKICKNTAKEIFLRSLKCASVLITNPENTLQVMYEKDGNNWLRIVKKYGAKTTKDEAIRVNYDEYKAGFKKCVAGKWLFHTFKERHIITWK